MIMERKWLVCASCFLVQFTVFGMHNNFGLIFHNLLEEFKQSPSETAWIGSLAMGLTFFVSPISQVLTLRIGFKVIIVASTLLCLVSLIASSFVSSTGLLLVTYSLLFGIGSGFANHASLVSLQESFDKQLSFANGLASSGAGFGALSLGPFLNYLLSNYKLRWTFRVCAILPLFFLFSVIISRKSRDNNDNSKSLVTLQDEENTSSELNNNTEKLESNDTIDDTKPVAESNKENLLTKKKEENSSIINFHSCMKKRSVLSEIFDKDVWLNKRYAIFVVGISIFLFGMPMPFIFLVQHATSQGVLLNQAQFLIGILAIVSTITKILSGFFLDMQSKISRSTLFLASMYLMGLSHLIAAFSTKYWQFCMYAILCGISEGCFVGQIAAVTVDLVQCKSKLGQALGNLFAVMSIPSMIGPVLAGKCSESTNSFKVPFYIACGFNLLAALVTTLIKALKVTADQVEDAKIASSGTTKVYQIKNELRNSTESLVLNNNYSVTFTLFTRSELYKKHSSLESNNF